jgi:hypothetical protein
VLITIDAGPTVTLEDPDDFTAFSIACREGLTDDDRTSAVARLGRAAGPDHVFVTTESLADLAGSRAADQDWQSGLAKMTAYAQSKGWVDEQGGIRAHIQ